VTIDKAVTATSLGNLAGFYMTREEYAQAEPLLQQSLKIFEQEKGPEHPETARTLNNLALNYMKQEKYAQAESLLQQALATRKQVLGPTHPHVAQTIAREKQTSWL
jgi:tetratricopeptide (TPR) repeat protein